MSSACTDAERRLLDAWMSGINTDDWKKLRGDVLKERVTDELRARIVQACRDEIRTRRRKHVLWDELAEKIGARGDDFAQIINLMFQDAEALEGPEPK